jgi:hypothetical protein
MRVNNQLVVPNKDFQGSMQSAMLYFQFYSISFVILSSIHVNMTRNQPVFDRIGPKFIFDAVFALLWNNYVIFWT